VNDLARPRDDEAGDILVVDDFPDARALYEALLVEDGHRVRTAASGRQALEEVAKREPDLVLLDVSMPTMDGYEVLRRLRALSGGGPAVVMLTAAAREAQAIERGLRAGADAYLTKPIDARELCARVRGALEVHRLRRMLEAHRRDQIAMLVHDLRHPLSSLKLVAELLEGDDLSPAERASAIETIRRMCEDMRRLVDGMLAASRLEAGVFAVERKRTRVGAIVGPALSVFRPLAARRRVAIEWCGADDLPIDADAPKLRQAIDNLLANAVKFVRKGGKVRIDAWVEEVAARPPAVVLQVSDDGPGIPVEERAHIFDRYRQGVRGRSAGGAGLGLAIARGIAEAHGGGIEVVDSPLGGAAFRLRVPML
jgi:two-component system sensor histidine kinase/response regulator